MPSLTCLSNYRLSRPYWMMGYPVYVEFKVNVSGVSSCNIKINVNQAKQYPILGGEVTLNVIDDANIWCTVNGNPKAIIPPAGAWTNITVPTTETADITSLLINNSENTIRVYFNSLMGGGVDIWIDAVLEYTDGSITISAPPTVVQQTPFGNVGQILAILPTLIILILIITVFDIFKDISRS